MLLPIDHIGGYSRAQLFRRIGLCAAGWNLGHVISFHVAPFQHALYWLSGYRQWWVVFTFSLCGLIVARLNAPPGTLTSRLYRSRIYAIFVIRKHTIYGAPSFVFCRSRCRRVGVSHHCDTRRCGDLLQDKEIKKHVS